MDSRRKTSTHPLIIPILLLKLSRKGPSYVCLALMGMMPDVVTKYNKGIKTEGKWRRAAEEEMVR